MVSKLPLVFPTHQFPTCIIFVLVSLFPFLLCFFLKKIFAVCLKNTLSHLMTFDFIHAYNSVTAFVYGRQVWARKVCLRVPL
ncbi:unnamed protein product [Phytomonas sp. EM1]|nr:unnamed protein product [Phytomonas sp. EM1]|eukprot:CCW64625.1 unnamed protein product [Phytomonas sp. isolate EM1]